MANIEFLMKKKNELSQYILDTIAANSVFFTGSCGIVNNDGTVNVKREKGTSVSAIAANITGSGDCAVFKVQGEYYAFSTVITKVEKEAIVVNRRSKKREESLGNLKVLFYTLELPNRINFYLGGDRSPKLLYFKVIPDVLLDIIAVTVKGFINNCAKNIYVAAIQDFSGKAYINETIVKVLSSEYYKASLYLGGGRWQSTESIKEDPESGVFIFPGYYLPIIKVGNNSVVNDILIENESTFVESLVYLYSDNSSLASHRLLTSISGSDGQGNEYSYQFEATTASSPRSSPKGKTTIKGKFFQ